MVESIARTVLKKAMKTWIVSADGLRTAFAQLREEVEDVVVEARHEYEHQAESTTKHRPTRGPEADEVAPTAPARQARRPRTGTTRTSKASKETAVAV